MSFINQTSPKARTTAILGTAAIQGIVGVVFVTGLATTLIPTEDPPPPPVTFEVKEEVKPLPPPPKPEVEAVDDTPTNPRIYTPPTAIDVNDSKVKLDTTVILPDLTDKPILNPQPSGDKFIEPTTKPTVAPKPAFDAIGARPSNNPGDWVSTSDYRSSWINREMTGSGRFALSISSAGKVKNCRVISTTGHTALDDATCRLMSRRARFNPARNTKGEKVSGEYVAAITWQLPD